MACAARLADGEPETLLDWLSVKVISESVAEASVMLRLSSETETETVPELDSEVLADGVLV